MKYVPFIFAAALATGSAFSETAAAVPDKDPTTQSARASTDTPYTEGEVRKIDKEAGKITLKHGPIANLEMPAMSMVFHAKDPRMLDEVKAGDKVRFRAEKIGGALTVTEIQPEK